MLKNPKVLSMICDQDKDGALMNPLPTSENILGMIENDTNLLKLFLKVTAAVVALAAVVSVVAVVAIATPLTIGVGALALGAGAVAGTAGVGAYKIDTGGEMKQSFANLVQAQAEEEKTQAI